MTDEDQSYFTASLKLDAMQVATKLPRARCIGILEHEEQDRHKRTMAAYQRLFGEVEQGK